MTKQRFHGSLTAQLVNIAEWLENGCDPKNAAEELRMLAGFVDRPASEPKAVPGPRCTCDRCLGLSDKSSGGI